MRIVLASGLILAACLASSSRAEDARKTEIRTLPKVAARSVIMKDVDAKDSEKESARARQFVQELIEAKEKKANQELAALTKKIKDEEDARQAAEKERRRRESNYEGSWGALVRSNSRNTQGVLKVKLDFQVLEIESYRNAADACKRMETLANDVVEALPKLDRDGDGKLTVEEYKEAGAILNATSKVFQSLDSAGDGNISEADVNSTKSLPANATAAVKAGRAAADAPGFKIKNYDADGDGILDVTERKTLTMAYVDAGLRWGQDAAFYTRLADNLSVARQVVAAKFASIDVGQ